MSTPALDFKSTKIACYSSYLTMAPVFCMPPLLFVTFRSMYGISYTLLGSLVLMNFIVQMAVDLTFTFVVKKFNDRILLTVMPLLNTAGMLIYALVPFFFPSAAFAGLAAGTVIFSLSAGLSEVLLSPTVAAIPSENPGGDLSLLHAVWGIGMLWVILVTTLYVKIFGGQNWTYLACVYAFLPVITALLFARAPLPERPAPVTGTASQNRRRRTGLLLCMACIFFGSCAETAMCNWIPGYLEQALGLDKTLGDIAGMAGFAVLFTIVRLLYGKFGKNIAPVLLIGMAGSGLCYLAAGLAPSVPAAFAACLLSGVFVSMLWPGVLILMEERIPGVGVSAFALMSAGGDLGASVSPQVLGFVVDRVAESSFAAQWGPEWNLTPEQIGMKAGMLAGSFFPIVGFALLLFALRYFGIRGGADAEPAAADDTSERCETAG